MIHKSCNLLSGFSMEVVVRKSWCLFFLFFPSLNLQYFFRFFHVGSILFKTTYPTYSIYWLPFTDWILVFLLQKVTKIKSTLVHTSVMLYIGFAVIHQFNSRPMINHLTNHNPLLRFANNCTRRHKFNVKNSKKSLLKGYFSTLVLWLVIKNLFMDSFWIVQELVWKYLSVSAITQ